MTPISEQDISDAYIYLLGRLLVTRQQQLDFREGFKWNELVHRKPGEVDWPNPNLDVAYSEAWVAVDENSCHWCQVPKVTGRYYTVQFLNGWGETVANINERVIADHPNGQFAVCLKGGNVAIPADARRIDLPVKYVARARAGRARRELGRGDRAAAPVHFQGDGHADDSGHSRHADLRGGRSYLASRHSRPPSLRSIQRGGHQSRDGRNPGKDARDRQERKGSGRARAHR